jgi:hypothetical protein
MGLWQLTSGATISPGATIRQGYVFSGQFAGQNAVNIPIGPVYALVSPIPDPVTDSNWVATVAQGFQLFGGQGEQDVGCVYTVDITCDDAEGTGDFGVYELWAQSFL